MKVSDAVGVQLNWMVATIEGYRGLRRNPHAFDQALIMNRKGGQCVLFSTLNYSEDWSIAGPIIERESISIVRLEDASIPDEKGYWQGVYAPRWAAVVGDKHRQATAYSSYGEVSGEGYEVDSEAVIGSTPLEAAMRAYVAKRLGNEIEVPGELK